MIEQEMPYNVPTDFFDRFPEKTLQLAKQRKNRRLRNNRIIRTIAMFSSAAAVLLLLTVVPPSKRQVVRGSENIEDVLQDLSNEDLAKMTEVYGSDMMEVDLSQEKNN